MKHLLITLMAMGFSCQDIKADNYFNWVSVEITSESLENNKEYTIKASKDTNGRLSNVTVNFGERKTSIPSIYLSHLCLPTIGLIELYTYECGVFIEKKYLYTSEFLLTLGERANSPDTDYSADPISVFTFNKKYQLTQVRLPVQEEKMANEVEFVEVTENFKNGELEIDRLVYKRNAVAEEFLKKQYSDESNTGDIEDFDNWELEGVDED